MSNEPKGMKLTGLDEKILLQGGTSTKVLSGSEKVDLTRRLAVVQALEVFVDTKKGDKFKAFDVGMRIQQANGEVSIDSAEAELIRKAVEKQWPQPGIYVPVCRWIEGVTA